MPKAHGNVGKSLGKGFQHMAKPGLRTCTCSKDKRHLSFAFSQENLFPRARRSRILKHGHGQDPAHGQTPFPATSLLGSESKPSFCGNTKRCCSLTPSHCQTAASHPPELLRKTHCPKKWLNPFSFFFFFLECKQNIPLGQTGIQQPGKPNPILTGTLGKGPSSKPEDTNLKLEVGTQITCRAGAAAAPTRIKSC